jgi:hypothetical protein
VYWPKSPGNLVRKPCSPATFTVSWGGQDGGGSGIASYSVYVHDNTDGTNTIWQSETPATSASFTGVAGHSYTFDVTAVDHVGLAQMRASSIFTTRIDVSPPTSRVQPLPDVEPSASFTLSWSGQDETGGSGVAYYDIYVSDNGGAFTPWLTGTTQTSATYAGQNGHSYGFYSVATDNAGNRQATPAAAQAVTQVLAPPVSESALIQFGSSSFTANVDAGSTNIILTRAGNLGATVTVVLSSPGGLAVRAFQETVSFGPNVTSQSIPIPIVNDGLPGRSDLVVPLSLSAPGAGTSLGAAASATLVIHDDNPPLVTLTSVRVATVKIGSGRKAKKVTGLMLQFSGALDPAQARNLAAYQLLAGKVKKSHTTFTKPVPLSTAIYDASAHTVTLLPRSKLNLAQPEQLRITGSMLTDSFGRSLDGNHDGQPGGDAVVVVSKSSVRIADRAQAVASPRLSVAAVDHLLSAGSREARLHPLVTPTLREWGSRRVVPRSGRDDPSAGTLLTIVDSAVPRVNGGPGNEHRVVLPARSESTRLEAIRLLASGPVLRRGVPTQRIANRFANPMSDWPAD